MIGITFDSVSGPFKSNVDAVRVDSPAWIWNAHADNSATLVMNLVGSYVYPQSVVITGTINWYALNTVGTTRALLATVRDLTYRVACQVLGFRGSLELGAECEEI